MGSLLVYPVFPAPSCLPCPGDPDEQVWEGYGQQYFLEGCTEPASYLASHLPLAPQSCPEQAALCVAPAVMSGEMLLKLQEELELQISM